MRKILDLNPNIYIGFFGSKLGTYPYIKFLMNLIVIEPNMKKYFLLNSPNEIYLHIFYKNIIYIYKIKINFQILFN